MASSTPQEDLWQVETGAALKSVLSHLKVSLEIFLADRQRAVALVQKLFTSDHTIKAARLYKWLVARCDHYLKGSEVLSDSNRVDLQDFQVSLQDRRYRYIASVNAELDHFLGTLRGLKLLDEDDEEMTESGAGAEKAAAGADEPWQPINDSDGIRSFYRTEGAAATHSFLVTGNVDTNVFNLLSMFYELDLYHTWFPMIKITKKIGEVAGARFRLLAQSHVASVWPVADREIVFHAYGDTVGDSIAIFARSVREQTKEAKILDGVADDGKSPESSPAQDFSSTITEEDKKSYQAAKAAARDRLSSNLSEFDKISQRFYEDFDLHEQFALPEPPNGAVRAELILSGILLTPLSPTSTRISACFNVNPRLSFLPIKLLNWFTNKLCYYLIRIMRSQAEKYFGDKNKKNKKQNGKDDDENNEYLKRIRENRHVYGEMERRLQLEMKHIVQQTGEEEEEKSQKSSKKEEERN